MLFLYFVVICYLAVFRLDELGMIHFKKFVSSQDVNRMYRVSKKFGHFVYIMMSPATDVYYSNDSYGYLFCHLYCYERITSADVIRSDLPFYSGKCKVCLIEDFSITARFKRPL